jgi:uncharacterized damage-inducible protein DinB
MNTREPLRLAAAYNRWVNGRLYDACARLSDADYRRNLGAFFRSVHGTLNHLLLGDLLWLGRLQGSAPAFAALDAELHGDFAALYLARIETDGALCAEVEALDAESLAQPLHFTSLVTGRVMVLPRWVAWTQLFNHQLHHRGQLTALLSRLGVDYGDIDLIRMPGATEAATRSPQREGGPR